MFFKIGAVGNFANLTRNTCVGVSFNKVAGLQDWNFIKRDSNAGVLKLLRTPIFTEHLQWLLLSLNPFDPIFLYFISHSTITPIESLYNQWYRKNYFPLSKKNKLNNSKKSFCFFFLFFFWWVYNFVLHISWKFKVVLTPYWVYAGILSYPDLVPSKYPNNTFYIKTDFSKLIFSSMWSEILSKTFCFIELLTPYVISAVMPWHH